MDWPRAKNILIIAFLGVNLLLGYRLWAGPAASTASLFGVSAREVREVTAQLRERGVVVAADIPRRAPPQPLLAVSNPEVDPVLLATRILGEGARVAARDGVWVARKGEEAAVIYPGGEVYYRRLADAPAGGVPPRDGPGSGGTSSGGGPGQPGTSAVVQCARDFWAARGGLPGVWEVDYLVPAGESRYLVAFTPRGDGHRMFSRRVMALVGPRGVEEAYGAWPVPDKPSGGPRAILPATEALLRVAPLLVQEGAVVLKVELGFYSPVYDAREWEAVPVWRVRLASGTALYVNAYTGALEGADRPYPRRGEEMFAELQKQGSRTK